MSPAPTVDLIERLQAAAEEGKRTVRELHEARRDARSAKAELEELVARVRSEVIAGISDMVKSSWTETMKGINVVELGAGLKDSFDKWVVMLAEATDVLEGLHRKDNQFAALLDRCRTRGL